MGTTTDLTPERDATQEELRQYEAAREKIKKLDTSGTYDASDPNQKLFFVSFDGTRNDRDSSDTEEIHTNPALLQEMVPNTDKVISEYIHGVGTRTDNLIEEGNECRTGAGSVERAEDAYDKFVHQVVIWQKETPDIEVHVSTAGFSRGTGSQRHFANLLHLHGVPDPDGDGYLIPPGGVHQDVMLMYDSVVTGQEDTLLLGIPPSVVGVHLTADHENRLNFDSASIVDPLYLNDPGILQFGLPGSHSDVGGNYGYNGLSARSLALGHELLQLMGVSIEEIPKENLFHSDDILIHDSGVTSTDSPKDFLMSLANVEFGEREEFITGNPARFAQLPPEVQEAALKLLEAERKAEETEIFGYTPAEWQALNEQLKKAEHIEQVGDDISELINSYNEGSDWEILESTFDLLSSLDKVIADNLKDLELDVYSDSIQGVSGIISVIGGWKDLEEALSDGNGWGVAEGGSDLVSGVTKAYDNLSDVDVNSTDLGKIGGAATSAIGLAIKVHDLLETLEDGDDTAKAKAALQVIESAIQTYVSVSSAIGTISTASTATTAATASTAATAAGSAMTTVGCSLPAIGAAIGYACAILTIADGDVEGGCEQIALTYATSVLMYCGPYGVAVALALQAASATRHLDGQLIDKESVEEFIDRVDFVGAEVTSVAFDSIELTSEIITKFDEKNNYLSPVNQEMYEDIGVEVPEDMEAELAFAQANIEMASPLRYASYYQDIDDLSLADIWESTYISQLISANVNQLKNCLVSARSFYVDGPSIAEDLVKAAFSGDTYTTIVDNIIGRDDPDEATASFTIDANGKVVMTTTGDSSMEASANSIGGKILTVMQKYKNGGGRLAINGIIPTIKVVSGEDSEISYGGDSGKITILLDSLSKAPARMRGALIARDHGERLQSAVNISRDIQGNIDLSKIDAIMRGHGFTKRGDNYVIGETREVYGTAIGTGVYRGGGQMGPEGKHFVANSSNIKSLPIPSDQLPSQQMGEISRVVSLKNIFCGSGAELLAMSLMLQGGLSATAGNANGSQSMSLLYEDYIHPITGSELEEYLLNGEFAQLYDAADALFSQGTFPDISNPDSLQKFLSEHWGELLNGYDWEIDSLVDTTHHFKEDIGYNGLLSDGSVAPWWNKDQTDLFFENQLDESNKSFSGQHISLGDVDALGASTSLVSNVETGAAFNMSEDSVMRFLLSDLAEDSLSTQYGNTTENYSFVSFGSAKNGKVWTDVNGDIRFEPTPGFVGTASFLYTIESPTGELIEKQAVVVVQNVNDAPTLQNDSFSLSEGTTFYLDRLLNNDSDIDGDILKIDHFRGVENGEISLINGRLAFIPDAGFFGDVEFSYWVRDHIDTYPAMATVSLQYQDINSGVAVEDDRFIVLEDTVLSTTVDTLLANDVEHDGEQISFVELGSATNGTVQLLGNGEILFTPDTNYVGADAGFHYKVKDDSGNITTGFASVEVHDSREMPVITGTTRAAINEDEILTFSPAEVATFIHDADGDRVHLEMITNVSGGSITIKDGYYTFVPDVNYSGQANFDYRASDNHGGTVDGNLAFNITAVNDAIDTGEDILVTIEEQSVTTTVTDLMANDTDVDGNIFDFVTLGSATNGIVTIDATNTITFTPEPDYFGEDAGFEYIVSDSEGLQSTGWVQIKVENVNDAPEIVGTTLSTQEDTAIVFDANSIASCFKDVDGDFLQVVKVEAESGGVVTLNNFQYIFTPDLNYNGDGAVRITISDGNGGEVSESVNISILAQNDAAIVGEDILTTDEEQSVITTIASLLVNDSDVDGALEFKALGDVFHGSVTLSDLGEILFTPEDNYFGAEAGFEYIVEDPAGNEATGRVTVQVANSNDPPQIISTSISTNEDEIITFSNDTISKFIQDIDGDAISLTSIDEIEGGTVTNDNGVYTFIPDSNYHGAATLSYSAENTTGETLSGKLDITILSQNDVTDFGDDSTTIQEDQTLLTSVTELLANDSDSDGALTFNGLGGAKFGAVVLAQDGSITFTPNKDYQGTEAGFSYAVIDAEGNEAEGWVSVQVDNVNDEPVITGNRIHLQEDESLAFTSEEISKFLYDADGELYNLDMVANVEGGRLELAGGVYTFIPDADYYGEASFDYIAKNGSGERINDTMHLAISPVNDLPIVQMTSATGTEDNEIILNVDTLMAGAGDVEDGSSLKFGGIDSSLHGDVYVDNNGSVHFLPDKDYFGNAAFRYDVIDSEGGISKGYVTLDIAGENDAPVAMDDEKIVAWSNSMYENVYLASAFLVNDIDVDFDPLTIISVGSAEYGTVSVDSTGNIKYIAASDEWVGIDTFTYTITDGSGETSQATAKLDVKINTSPDVYPELLFTEEDNISIIKQADLLANDSDVDGDSITIIAVDQAEHCTVEIMANGDIKFTPELNFNNKYPGQASFRYTVSDGVSTPAVAVAFFDIDPVNDAPILRPERIDGAVEDNSFSFTVAQIMANDTDVEMESQYEEDSISFVEVFNAGHGTISSDETGIIFYTSDPNFCGVETFQYKVIDSYGAESIIESEIWVEPVNDIPVVQDDVSTTVAEDCIPNYYSISNLVANDFDVDGDTLTIKDPTVIAGSGSVSVSGGNLVVTPQSGEDYMEVQYTVTDGNGGDVISTLTIPEIKAHNFAPEFSGLYRTISHTALYTTFSFHVSDRNGGDNWTLTGGQNTMGDIVSISAGSFNTNCSPSEFKELNAYGHFGILLWPSVPSESRYANFTLTAVDRSGASSTIRVEFMDMNWTVGNHHYPVILDLDNDGVELISAKEGTGFDWNGDGEQEITGWVGKDDGFLVYDHDGDKQVTQANEIALKEYYPDARTDLEGLQGFDSNNNGLFDVDDEKWQEFGVWQDKNSNGITDEGEFSTLDEQGIVSIDLQSDENYSEQNDNVVYGATTYQKSDGSVHEVLDVGLNGEMTEAIEVESSSVFLNNSSASTADTLTSSHEDETSNLLNTENVLTDNILTDGELDRQFVQMQSDLATKSTTENETQNESIILPDASFDGQSILGEQDQEYQIA